MSKEEQYIKEQCVNCKNKNTDLCHITINEKRKAQCVFKEE